MSDTRGNRRAYLNTAEYVLSKVIELLERDGLKGTDSWVHATEAYERVFKAREMDLDPEERKLPPGWWTRFESKCSPVREA